MFCPQCGSFMMPKKNTEKKKAPAKKVEKKKGSKKDVKKKEVPIAVELAPKKILACTSCSYTMSDEKGSMIVKETVNQPEEIVSIIDKDVNTMPLIDAPCPKCTHQKAFFWTLQTRSADEPETKFMRCEKCKHTWRDYD